MLRRTVLLPHPEGPKSTVQGELNPASKRSRSDPIEPLTAT